MLNVDDIQIHRHYRNEETKLYHMLESTSSLPWVKWILKHQVEIHANKQLDRKIYQSETIDLSCKKHNHRLKVFIYYNV